MSGYEEDSIAYQLLWNSKRTTLEGRTYSRSAIIGFNGIVLHEGHHFTEAFWDALSEGDTVEQAFSESNTAEPDVGNICVILGDSSVKMAG